MASQETLRQVLRFESFDAATVDKVAVPARQNTALASPNFYCGRSRCRPDLALTASIAIPWNPTPVGCDLSGASHFFGSNYTIKFRPTDKTKTYGFFA